MADHPPRLYLVTPPIEAFGELPSGFDAALARGDVACLLLRFKALPERAVKEIVKQVAGLVQPHGTALLVEDARVAAHTGADGVHLSESGQVFTDALDSLKPERIVGIGGVLSRDDAMRVGEAGADYIMFGGPDESGDAAETLERVSWWAEIFNVPCVGFAESLQDVEALAATGAEFVGLGDAVWRDPRGAAAAIAEAEGALVRGAGRVPGRSA